MTFINTVLLYLLLFRVAVLTAAIVSIVLGYKLFCRGIGVVASSGGGSTIESSVVGAKMTVRNAAPGTAFALFGAIVVVVMLIQSSPSVTWESVSKWKSAEAAQDGEKLSGASAERIINTPVAVPDAVRQGGAGPTRSAPQGSSEPQRSGNSGNYEQATKLVMKGEGQDSLAALTAQGIEYEKVGDLANAERSYRKAVTVMAEPMNLLAWLYFKSGRANDGIGLATVAVQLRPDEPRYRDTLQKVKTAQ